MTVAQKTVVTRAQVEDFLYYEAALLDAWKLDEWQTLLTDDAAYYVPPNDKLVEGDLVTVTANFVCYRFRRNERIREYVGGYRFILKVAGDSFRIKERRVFIDAHELGSLGSVSFIL
jgi:p-cumate 2,3-dioxygenase subunit beta